MYRRYGNAGCYLWLGMIGLLITAPFWLWLITIPLKFFVGYGTFGTDVIGLEPKSFGMLLYFMLPFGVLIICLLFLSKFFERLAKKLEKKENL